MRIGYGLFAASLVQTVVATETIDYDSQVYFAFQTTVLAIWLIGRLIHDER
jgi:hypothetical protein